MTAFLDLVKHDAALSYVIRLKEKKRKSGASYLSSSSLLQSLGKQGWTKAMFPDFDNTILKTCAL